MPVICIGSGSVFSGFMMSGGYVVNVGDFSGVHSGVVFGICNTVCKIFLHLIDAIRSILSLASIGGFCAPYITSIITKHVCITSNSENESVLIFSLFRKQLLNGDSPLCFMLPRFLYPL